MHSITDLQVIIFCSGQRVQKIPADEDLELFEELDPYLRMCGAKPVQGKFAFSVVQCPVSVTPASAKVLHSTKTFADASIMFMASADPVPSPRRMFRFSIGFIPIRSHIARCPGSTL
jgi:hypothetical protein